jgi:prephenate dehydratase
MIIGYQGIVGCDSYNVIKKYFNNYTLKNYLTVEDLFVSNIDYIILPIRNSITGDIKENMDLVNKYKNFNIVTELLIDNQNVKTYFYLLSNI